MRIVLENVLTLEDIAQIRYLIAEEAFVDGKSTSTLVGKKNLQLVGSSSAAQAISEIIVDRLTVNEAFQLAVQPNFIHIPLISRYDVGMSYPEHVDNAIMGGRRVDVALTLFLSDLDSYDGGDLVIATGTGEIRYRLPPGHLIAYPASTLHSVAPVTRGTRLAVVLWVQSSVRDPEKRQILYELGMAMGSMAEGPYSARLRRSYWNLVRLWAEV